MSTYTDELRRLRKIPAKGASAPAWCYVDSANGPEPYAGPVMHLAHVLLTKTDLVDLGDNLYYTGEVNPWLGQSPEGHAGVLKGPSVIWRAPVYGLAKPDSFHTRTSIFSDTTKMRCPSFSLPAGPPGFGGSCAQANRADLMKGRPEDLYICRNCYSIQGKYGNANVQLAQAVTLAWVKMLLAENDGGRSFARAMVATLSDYLVHGHSSMDLRYFRIHDSGDLAWGRDDYFLAWCRIAAAFEGQVSFWAPTRDQHSPQFAALVARTKRPSNFVLRPSALHFQAQAPRGLRGFDAGSTSAYRVTDLPDPIPALADFDCPAYAGGKQATCLNGTDPDGRQPCRACWTHPELTINYQPHKAAPAKYALGIVKRRRRNPEGLDDDALTDLDRADAEADIPLDLG